MPEQERRCIDMQLRAIQDQGQIPSIRGYGSVFNSLSENLGGFREIIAPGAFDDALEHDVRALFNHDPNHILGRTTSGTLRLSVDERGLHYDIDMPDTSVARDLMVSIQRGDVNQSSFGFTVDEDSWEEDDEGRVVRTIHKVKRLFDVSPVTYPAYPETSTAKRALDHYQQEKAAKQKTQQEQRNAEQRTIAHAQRQRDIELLQLRT